MSFKNDFVVVIVHVKYNIIYIQSDVKHTVNLYMNTCTSPMTGDDCEVIHADLVS